MKIYDTSSEYSIDFGEPTNWWELKFNSKKAIRVTSVSGVDHVQSGFEWNFSDGHTNNWFPQGLTGLQTTDSDNNTYKFMIVSWYNSTGAEGVRLSFVDTVDPRKYLHVLLVMPDENNTIVPLTKVTGSKNESQHAGGIATIGNAIYVADTSFGIREFDLQRIYKSSNVESFNDNYQYIMPQQRSYDASDYIKAGAGNVPKFSYLSRIWTDGTPQLLSGNFNIDGDDTFGNSPSRVCRWEVGCEEDQQSWSITQTGPIIQLNCQAVQGAVLRLKGNKEVLYLSRSYGKERYNLYVVEVPADASEYVITDKLGVFTKYDWCNYSEDLHLSTSDRLWCHKEKSSRRVFYVDPDIYHV